jgi:hypothetical protein
MTLKKVMVITMGLAFFIVLATHTSDYPTVFNRYSVEYVAFLVGYLVVMIGMMFLYHDRVRALQLRTNLAKALKSFISSLRFGHVLTAVVLFHSLLVLDFLRPTLVFSSRPVLQMDYAHHYYQVALVVKALESEGKTWAYDTSFCTGYPEGTLFDTDMKLFELVTFVLTRIGLSVPFVFNGLIFLSFWLVPLLLFWSCRNFNLSNRATLLVVTTSVVLWHGYWMIYYFNLNGLVAFIFGTYWSVLVVSLFYRYLVKGKWFDFAFFVICFSVSFMTHILMPLLIVVPMVVLYGYHFKNLTIANHLALMASVLVVIVANLWWIQTVAQFYQYRIETPDFSPPSLTESLRIFFKLKDFEIGLALLGMWGFYHYRTQERCLGVMGVLWIGWFLFMTYGLEGIPWIRSLEPSRFKMPVVILSTVGLSLGASLLKLRSSFNRIDSRFATPLVIIALYFFGGFLIPREASDERFGDPYEALNPLITWIQENATKEARIAFMDCSPGYLTAAKMHYYTQRDFIGGPCTGMNMKHSYVGFTPDRFFDRQINDLTEKDLLHYADLFNIRWLITTTDEGFAAFSKFSAALRLKARLAIVEYQVSNVSRSGSPFSQYIPRPGEHLIGIFEVQTKPGYFLKGDGVVETSINQIRVRDASPGGVVLKFHWLETLAVDPPLPLIRYPVEGSPVGFIQVENGDTKVFRIYNSYENRASLKTHEE